MKTSCKIIEDLLPLYADDVCSKESKEFVDEHLAECPECTGKLKLMSDTGSIKADITPLQNVGNWLEKLRLKALLKGILNGIIFTVVLVLGYLFLTELYIVKVPADRVTVSDVCMFSDGNIAFHMYIDDEYDLNSVSATRDSHGNMYITPKRTIVENRRLSDIGGGLYDTYYAIGIRPDSTKNEYRWMDFSFEPGEEPNAVYLRLRGEDILIWEKGMELPAASEELEEDYFNPVYNGNG